jgi:hypothetical protein
MGGSSLSALHLEIARDYFGRSVADLLLAQLYRDQGDRDRAELRLRTGRHFGACAAGSLGLALRRSRSP